ncbi:MAG: pyruvate kinase, partial [Rhodanobacteraceae bacterium]
MDAQVRRTKIIATLGPATDASGMLKKLLAEGVDVVRLNLSHGVADDHR